MAKNYLKEPEENSERPEKQEENEDYPEKKKKKDYFVLKALVSVLDGTILTRETVVKSIPFVFYLTFIAILYIANTYYAEKKTIEIEKVKKELKELRSENISTKSNLMFCSRQTEVIKRLGQTGLKESLMPPFKIIVENKTTVADTVKSEE